MQHEAGKGSAPRKQQDQQAYASNYDRIFKKAGVVEQSPAAEPMTMVGADGKPWPLTFDAVVWATEFNRRFPSVPTEDCLSWFANALMRGFDEANWRRAEQDAQAKT